MVALLSLRYDRMGAGQQMREPESGTSIILGAGIFMGPNVLPSRCIPVVGFWFGRLLINVPPHVAYKLIG